MTSPTVDDQPRRLGADARRDQILDCAVRLFGERPYDDVGTSDIAQEAGVTRGLLHHYFGTKRGLYVEVVKRMLDATRIDLVAAEMASPGRGRASVRRRAERGVDHFLDAVEAHGKTFVAVSHAEGIGTDPEVGEILARADDLSAKAMLSALGLPDPGRESEEYAVMRSYLQLVKGATREWQRDRTLRRDQVRRLLVETITTITMQVLPRLDDDGED
ncbi:MAG: helix-turn-helix domain containing protein [Propionibacteriales bacterium]|nr:helix-turn-helix domain containing protein [Propionibacteriales bacterium]